MVVLTKLNWSEIEGGTSLPCNGDWHQSTAAHQSGGARSAVTLHY